MVGFAGPMRQDRLTVLTRLILAIPHFISLLVAIIATLMVIVGGWFGALFRGRLSEPVTEYLVGYHQWKARLYAYLLLLTDKYPPVGWRDTDYPVRVVVRPGRLNRLAVLFRLVLAVPALLVEVVLVLVLVAIVMPITWLIVLSLGSMPQPLHEAISAAARYLARVNGYMWLLTSEYPGACSGAEHAHRRGPGRDQPRWLPAPECPRSASAAGTSSSPVLPGLGGKARPAKLRVDGQQGPAAHGERPVPGADDVKPPLVPIGLHGAVLWRAGPRVVADGVVAGTLTTPGLIPASPKRTLRDYAGALPANRMHWEQAGQPRNAVKGHHR